MVIPKDGITTLRYIYFAKSQLWRENHIFEEINEMVIFENLYTLRWFLLAAFPIASVSRQKHKAIISLYAKSWPIFSPTLYFSVAYISLSQTCAWIPCLFDGEHLAFCNQPLLYTSFPDVLYRGYFSYSKQYLHILQELKQSSANQATQECVRTIVSDVLNHWYIRLVLIP